MKTLILALFFILCIGNVHSQSYYMERPEGFGAATTGGGNAPPVTVFTYTDLKAKLKLATPQVILVSGTITIPAGQSISEVVTNKSLIGLPGARLVNTDQTKAGSGILNLKDGSHNVIIRNLIFEGGGAYDVDGRDNLTSDGCINLWVDHCEFQDGVDGNFDIKGNSDNITVSWCKFTYLKPPKAGGPGGSNDHRFSNLVGSSDADAPADGHYSVTFQNCYWADGCRERMPRARNAEIHILNCYYNTNISSSRALGISGGVNTSTCYVENSDFEKIGTVYRNYGGTVAINFENCLNGASNIGTVAPPPYAYTKFPVEDVARFVSDSSCGAGATLQVTSSGEISSKCESLGIEEHSKFGLKYYPTLIDDLFHIEFQPQHHSNAIFTLYSMSGQELYTKSIDIQSNSRASFNLGHYPQGIYFGTLKIGNTYETIRLIKK